MAERKAFLLRLDPAV